MLMPKKVILRKRIPIGSMVVITPPKAEKSPVKYALGIVDSIKELCTDLTNPMERILFWKPPLYYIRTYFPKIRSYNFLAHQNLVRVHAEQIHLLFEKSNNRYIPVKNWKRISEKLHIPHK